MPEMTRYEHGVPSWVDIGTQDPSTGVRFYSELFGWEGQDMGEEAGHYTIVTKDGKQVAAISPAQDPGPPRWTTYINVAARSSPPPWT
jgi:predicted enzyme related to lactoylglutathione lyase